MILLDNSIPHDWFDWSNSGVGIVSLAFTLWAVRQATGAKTAAQDARQAVYRRDASDDVRRLERIAFNLLTAIETDQDDLASHQARDFIAECLNVREHHRARLRTNGGKLDVAFTLVSAISREIQRTEASRSALVEIAQRVVGDVSSLSGILSRSIEEEEQ
jgi:uncharacterized sporulation protein YeaH/YhbH (DUF444 family)